MLWKNSKKAKKQPLRAAVFGQTDIGVVRKNNEDSLLMADLSQGMKKTDTSPLNHVVGERGSVFIVADGMGGANAGEVASLMAVETVSRRLSQQLKKAKRVDRQLFARALQQSVEEANSLIHQEGQKHEECKGMGTTLTAAGVYDGGIFFAQVGDSRGYLMRNGSLGQMTQDQSLMAHLIASGAITPEEAKHHPQRNIVLQALGVQSEVNVAVSFDELRKGDMMLVCSDGLWGKFERGDELKEVLKKSSSPEQACQQLITIARERGGEDNITVIVAKFDGERLQPPSPGELPVGKPFDFVEEEARVWHFWPWGKR